MPIGDIAAGSFDAYEGIRIAIPGALGVAAASEAYQTICMASSNPLTGSAGVAIVAALILGLLFYFADIPAKSAAYEKDQPTRRLWEDYRTSGLTRAEFINRYFILFDTDMPATIRNRSLYMGSMYRIGVEMILLAGLTTYSVVGAAAADYGQPAQGHRSLLLSVGAGCVGVVIVSGFIGNFRYEGTRARRSNRSVPTAFEVAKSAANDLSRNWWAAFFLGLVIQVSAVFVGGGARRFLVPTGLAIAFMVWAIRYVRGQVSSAEPEPLSAVTAGTLYGLPLGVSWVVLLSAGKSILYTDARVMGWLGAAALTLALIMVRGHERKLLGGYYSQRAWCQQNKDAVDRILLGAQPTSRPVRKSRSQSN